MTEEEVVLVLCCSVPLNKSPVDNVDNQKQEKQARKEAVLKWSLTTYDSKSTEHYTVTPDSVRGRGNEGTYPLPSCITTPNQIKQRK